MVHNYLLPFLPYFVLLGHFVYVFDTTSCEYRNDMTFTTTLIFIVSDRVPNYHCLKVIRHG